MEPATDDIRTADVVVSTAGRDKGCLYYVVGTEGDALLLANGRNRTLEKPKRKRPRHMRKVLRSETRVAEKLLSGGKLLNSELRRDLAFLARQLQSE